MRRGSVAFHAKAGAYSVKSTSLGSTPYRLAINPALITPVARTRSKSSLSSNMMSSVTSNGPAFLLLQAFAMSFSFAMSHRFVLDRKHLQRIVGLDHVLQGEFVDRPAL